MRKPPTKIRHAAIQGKDTFSRTRRPKLSIRGSANHVPLLELGPVKIIGTFIAYMKFVRT